MWANSIRAIVSAWYAAILVVSLAVFAVVLYSAQRRSLLRELDDRLATQAAAIAATTENDEDGIEMELDEEFLAPFRADGPEHPYFAVLGPDGAVVVASRPGDAPARDDRREIVVAGQDGLQVLVSMHTGPVHAELREFLWMLVAYGLGVLALALLGGWLVSGRVLAPLRRMSAAAAEISAADPMRRRRLDIGATASELATLATTLNDAFDRLQGALDRQNRFTADASHELRTPVSVILATAQQSLEREREPAQYRQALEAVMRAARRMRIVVDGLLTLTHADSGEASFERGPVELSALLRETLEQLQPLAAARRIGLRCTGPEVTLDGDRDRLREVFTNLVANGIRYNRPDGRVDVGVSLQNGSAVVTVADTGVGIAAEHLVHVFDRFYRADPARTHADDTAGAGLGLSIARWIVERHGGAIDVASRPGVGSTFTVRLPVGA